MGGDLEVAPVLAAADGAEALPLGPHSVGPPPHRRLDVVGTGVGGEVEVHPCRIPVEEEVAHRSTDEVGPVPSRTEASGHRPHLVEHGAGDGRGPPLHATGRLSGDRRPSPRSAVAPWRAWSTPWCCSLLPGARLVGARDRAGETPPPVASPSSTPTAGGCCAPCAVPGAPPASTGLRPCPPSSATSGCCSPTSTPSAYPLPVQAASGATSSSCPGCGAWWRRETSSPSTASPWVPPSSPSGGSRAGGGPGCPPCSTDGWRARWCGTCSPRSTERRGTPSGAQLRTQDHAEDRGGGGGG